MRTTGIAPQDCVAGEGWGGGGNLRTTAAVLESSNVQSFFNNSK